MGNDESNGSSGRAGAAPASAGGSGIGGTTSVAGATHGGGVNAGGNTGFGGARASAGIGGSVAGSDGMESVGGSNSVGGKPARGGAAGAGGSAGSSSTGGHAPFAGASGMGAAGAGSAAGGTGAGAGGGGNAGGSGGQRPCDIYAAASTPCVAAHSTVRALYAAYSGPLYQLRRASDKQTKDVSVQSAGGFVDVSVQDSFCNGTTCTISILYDQSSNENDLTKSPVAHWLTDGGTEANATKGKTTVGGHTAYGIYVTGYSDNVAYRNNATKGVAKNDEPEAMYMIVDGKRFSDQCCFDYGNAETSGNDEGNGTMEAVYFGSDITWGGKGDGNGPWVAGDLENGVFKSDKGGWQSQSIMVPGAKSISTAFAVAMLKGPSGNHFTLKGGSALSGSLTTMWDSVRPSPGYSPKKLQGAIILGTGGDGSNGGTGTFYEGAMTAGNPPDSVDDAVQANIVAAGYGH
jgi:hypothetical protein